MIILSFLDKFAVVLINTQTMSVSENIKKIREDKGLMQKEVYNEIA